MWLMFRVDNKDDNEDNNDNDVVLVSLLLTLNIFNTFLHCFHCWHWTNVSWAQADTCSKSKIHIKCSEAVTKGVL